MGEGEARESLEMRRLKLKLGVKVETGGEADGVVASL